MNNLIRIGKEEFGLLEGINRLMTIFRQINNVWPTKLLIGSVFLGALKEIVHQGSYGRENLATYLEDKFHLTIVEMEQYDYLWVC
jgi:hypothetical protein